MPDVLDIAPECPTCGEPYVIARVIAGGGNTYIPDATVFCTCGTVYIATAAMLSGSLQPIFTYAIPIPSGDSGGADVLSI